MSADSWPAHDEDLRAMRRVVVVPGGVKARTAPGRTKAPHEAGLKAGRSSPHADPRVPARPVAGNHIRAVAVPLPDDTERYRSRHRSKPRKHSNIWLVICVAMAAAALAISSYLLVRQHQYEACVNRNLSALHEVQVAVADYSADDSPPALEACGGGPSAPRWINPS